MTIVEADRAVTGGVDTHLDAHVAAALDDIGGVLGVETFATTPAGYRELTWWLQGFGVVVLVGVEGTGSYGAGLARHLRRAGIDVVEVDRPNRQLRRREGKTDPVDAVEAARALQSGASLSNVASSCVRSHPRVDGRQTQRPINTHQDVEPDPPSRVHRSR